jgi:hypothetical protein
VVENSFCEKRYSVFGHNSVLFSFKQSVVIYVQYWLSVEWRFKIQGQPKFGHERFLMDCELARQVPIVSLQYYLGDEASVVYSCASWREMFENYRC